MSIANSDACSIITRSLFVCCLPSCLLVCLFASLVWISDISALFLAEIRELACVRPSDSVDRKVQAGSNASDLPWDGSGGIPWLCLADSLPPALSHADVAQMWKRMQSSTTTAISSNALTTAERNSVILIEAENGLFLFNKLYTVWLLKVFEGDAKTMGEVVAADLKSKQAKATLSISSNASVSASSVGVSSSTVDEDWDDDGPPVKGKKATNRTIKGKKVSKKSVRVASNNKDSGLGCNSSGSRDLSVEALMAPYVAEERLLRLVREACEELFSLAASGGDGGAGDDDETNEEHTPMLTALIRNMHEDILVIYKTFAARAKEEANQV